jgi:hypothetical protein
MPEYIFKLDEIHGGSLPLRHAREFAHTVKYISKKEKDDVPSKHPYPVFKKTFWEEDKFNAGLANPSQEYSHDAHMKEQEGYWDSSKGSWNRSSRFINVKDYTERGPTKVSEYDHIFEKGTQYYGRKREILPYMRARLYTSPNERYDTTALTVSNSCL